MDSTGKPDLQNAGLTGVAYLALLDAAKNGHSQVRETLESPGVSERALQVLWYDQTLAGKAMHTAQGQRIEVLSPGWWNHSAGPDFCGAQIRFNGELFSGDVEIHIGQDGWKAHGHHLDPRYDNVILHVVLYSSGGKEGNFTSAGRAIPTLFIKPYLQPGWEWNLPEDDTLLSPDCAHGKCSQLIPAQGVGPLLQAIELAAEWRMLTKARAMRERMDRSGGNQALYEMIAYAAGVNRFKYHFQAIARQLPYERAVQLAHQDPMLLEAALLQIAGLLPDSLPEGTTAVPHHARLRGLRRDYLSGMRSLPLAWKRVALRPANNPERRLAGLARLIARTAQRTLFDAVLDIWLEPVKPTARYELFEQLFPTAMGFWANHYTWTGKMLERPSATLGAQRIHSIVGNVFIPFGLAIARQRNDRSLEEQVIAFLRWLPKESKNAILERMVPHVLGSSGATLRLRFQLQQGLLQMHSDWCGPNPSCANCTMYSYLDRTGPERRQNR